jgi:hypothetical protein
LRAAPLGGYAPGVSRAFELETLAFAVLSGCAAPAQSPGGSRPNGPSPTASPDADPAAPVLAAGELDAASVRALGPVPRQLDRFHLDPYAEVRAFGTNALAPLERACERILGPGCVDGQGLEHVLALRYVGGPGDVDGPGDVGGEGHLDGEGEDGQGSRATLDVLVARYDDAESAYSSFTESLIGEHDPLELTARPLDVPGLGVLDGERVGSWLGRHVISLFYTDPVEPSDRRQAQAAAELPGVTRRLLAALPAEPDLPLSVQKLPRAHRIPLGARLVAGDALGVPGMGMGAVGYYRDADKRWRVLAIVRPDVESAKDVLATLGKNPAARRIVQAPLEAFAFTERRLPAEPYVGWVVGRRHEVVYGIGDEATALPEFMPAEREAAVKLSPLEKLVKLTQVHLE